jgi:hypothetical protein
LNLIVLFWLFLKVDLHGNTIAEEVLLTRPGAVPQGAFALDGLEAEEEGAPGCQRDCTNARVR